MGSQCSAAPPLFAEDDFVVEDGALQLLLEEWHTLPEVFG
jgi:hypothetical protein